MGFGRIAVGPRRHIQAVAYAGKEDMSFANTEHTSLVSMVWSSSLERVVGRLADDSLGPIRE